MDERGESKAIHYNKKSFPTICRTSHTNSYNLHILWKKSSKRSSKKPRQVLTKLILRIILHLMNLIVALLITICVESSVTDYGEEG